MALLGVPIQAGTRQAGCLMGPAALRTAGIASVLEDLGCRVVDHGDLAPGPMGQDPVDPVPTLRNLGEVAAWTRVIGQRVHDSMQAGELPIVLGGDHSLSMGSVDGVARHCREAGRELFVLWLDAHADFNTPDTSPSGNMHGMPLAALCGEPDLAGRFPGSLCRDAPRTGSRASLRHPFGRSRASARCFGRAASTWWICG